MFLKTFSRIFRVLKRVLYIPEPVGAPRVAKNNKPLPPAREISLDITEIETDLKSTKKSDLDTVLVMQMGQFIDHDITHAPQFQVSDCCSSENRINRKECYPLFINSDTDPKWAGIGDCMSFTRSLRSSDLKCSLDTNIQQVSEI